MSYSNEDSYNSEPDVAEEEMDSQRVIDLSRREPYYEESDSEPSDALDMFSPGPSQERYTPYVAVIPAMHQPWNFYSSSRQLWDPSHQGSYQYQSTLYHSAQPDISSPVNTPPPRDTMGPMSFLNRCNLSIYYPRISISRNTEAPLYSGARRYPYHSQASLAHHSGQNQLLAEQNNRFYRPIVASMQNAVEASPDLIHESVELTFGGYGTSSSESHSPGNTSRSRFYNTDFRTGQRRQNVVISPYYPDIDVPSGALSDYQTPMRLNNDYYTHERNLVRSESAETITIDDSSLSSFELNQSNVEQSQIIPYASTSGMTTTERVNASSNSDFSRAKKSLYTSKKRTTRTYRDLESPMALLFRKKRTEDPQPSTSTNFSNGTSESVSYENQRVQERTNEETQSDDEYENLESQPSNENSNHNDNNRSLNFESSINQIQNRFCIENTLNVSQQSPHDNTKVNNVFRFTFNGRHGGSKTKEYSNHNPPGRSKNLKQGCGSRSSQKTKSYPYPLNKKKYQYTEMTVNEDPNNTTNSSQNSSYDNVCEISTTNPLKLKTDIALTTGNQTQSNYCQHLLSNAINTSINPGTSTSVGSNQYVSNINQSFLEANNLSSDNTDNEEYEARQDTNEDSTVVNYLSEQNVQQETENNDPKTSENEENSISVDIELDNNDFSDFSISQSPQILPTVENRDSLQSSDENSTGLETPVTKRSSVERTVCEDELGRIIIKTNPRPSTSAEDNPVLYESTSAFGNLSNYETAPVTSSPTPSVDQSVEINSLPEEYYEELSPERQNLDTSLPESNSADGVRIYRHGVFTIVTDAPVRVYKKVERPPNTE